jgi:hypothetical protein
LTFELEEKDEHEVDEVDEYEVASEWHLEMCVRIAGECACAAV